MQACMHIDIDMEVGIDMHADMSLNPKSPNPEIPKSLEPLKPLSP